MAHPEPPADRERFIDEYAHHIADQMGNPEVDCTVCGNDDHLKLIEAGAYHHRGGSEPAEPRSFAGFLTSGRLA